MEGKSKRPVPEEVRQAQMRHDHEALSKLGRVGGEHASIIRNLRKEEKKHSGLEVALEVEKTGHVSPEGDVLPPDPDTIESLEEVLKN